MNFINMKSGRPSLKLLVYILER